MNFLKNFTKHVLKKHKIPFKKLIFLATNNNKKDS